MEKKIAKHIVVTAFRCSSKLSSILVVAKDHCTAAEYESVHVAVASVAAEISIKLVNPILHEHPDIGEEIDQEIEEFGRVL